jgi:hypothetical protein
MRIRSKAAILIASFAAILIACGAAGAASAQRPADLDSDPMAAIGFHYALPAEWTVTPVKPPEAPKTEPTAAPVTEEQKRGTACIQVALTAQHGSPSSVIVVVALPFDCFGETLAEPDLAGFGSGAVEGLKQTFDLLQPVYGAYSLGSHRLWIERAKGNPKGHAETQYTVEIACSVLAKGAACWMTMAADAASLEAFEKAAVTLDGDAATPLVPATAFDKGPS